MAECEHGLIEWQQLDEEDMHCLGWICRTCGDLRVGEYHHQTWCREDFCGAPPLADPTPELSGACV